jgi:acetyl-CoA carboxylase biotin carboxyl carrier protein
MATARKGAKAVEKSKATGAAPSSIVDTVRSLAEVVAEHSLSELVVETADATITLRRGMSAAVAAMPMSMPMPAMSAPMATMPMSAGPPFSHHSAAHAHATQAAAAEPSDNAHVVTSPFVGTFYRRPNPDSTNYVEINERVDKGAVLCIVEAMKLMNEIEADISGTVIGVLAEDGAPVEYGQPLFRIAPA